VAFGVLAVLFDTIRTPIIRLIVALIFAAPAAVVGFALFHGITKDAVPSEIWGQRLRRGCGLGEAGGWRRPARQIGGRDSFA